MDYVEGIDAGDLSASNILTGMPLDQVQDRDRGRIALDYAHNRGCCTATSSPPTSCYSPRRRWRSADPVGRLRNRPQPPRHQRIDRHQFRRRNDALIGTGTTDEPRTGRSRRSVRPSGHRLPPAHRVAAFPSLESGNDHRSPPHNDTTKTRRHTTNLAALDPVLAVALAKNPEKRFPRCTDFASAFASAAVHPHAAGKQGRKGPPTSRTVRALAASTAFAKVASAAKLQREPIDKNAHMERVATLDDVHEFIANTNTASAPASGPAADRNRPPTNSVNASPPTLQGNARRFRISNPFGSTSAPKRRPPAKTPLRGPVSSTTTKPASITRDVTHARGRRRRGLTIASAALAILLLAAALLLPQWQRDPAPTEPTSPPTSPMPSMTFDGMRDFVAGYYADLPSHPMNAWAKLDAHSQNQTGQREFLDFWATIESVTLISVSPRDATSVVARLAYVRRNGHSDTEDRWLKMAQVDSVMLLDESGRIGGGFSDSLTHPIGRRRRDFPCLRHGHSAAHASRGQRPRGRQRRPVAADEAVDLWDAQQLKAR